MDDREPPKPLRPAADSSPASSSDRLSEQVDRAVGLMAQAVTLAEKQSRIYAADRRLDERTRQEQRHIFVEMQAQFAQLARGRAAWLASLAPDELAAAVPKATIDAARKLRRDAELTGTEIVPVRRKRDDSITLKVTIPTGEGGKKHRKKVIATLLKALAAAAAGAILRHLAGS